MVAEINLNFYNLPRQGRSNYFADGYCKTKLFASATISTSLSIYLGKLLKLLLDKNGMGSHAQAYAHKHIYLLYMLLKVYNSKMKFKS